MKEMNPLETQLRSWQPRRPSARLRRRLFGFSFAPRTGWVIGSLAPAAVCLLMTLGISNSHTIISGPLNASTWSNADCVVDGFTDKQNHWACVTFDSTNRSGLGSTTGSFRH
jgi:hypothetical protein